MSEQEERNRETPLRWLAMSIVAAPPKKRGVQYLIVRKNITESLERFGMKGAEARDRLKRNMGLIRGFVRQIEAITSGKADAA
jgi:hypothetical protein